jgi:hypothetical protein
MKSQQIVLVLLVLELTEDQQLLIIFFSNLINDRWDCIKIASKFIIKMIF